MVGNFFVHYSSGGGVYFQGAPWSILLMHLLSYPLAFHMPSLYFFSASVTVACNKRTLNDTLFLPLNCTCHLMLCIWDLSVCLVSWPQLDSSTRAGTTSYFASHTSLSSPPGCFNSMDFCLLVDCRSLELPNASLARLNLLSHVRSELWRGNWIHCCMFVILVFLWEDHYTLSFNLPLLPPWGK